MDNSATPSAPMPPADERGNTGMLTFLAILLVYTVFSLFMLVMDLQGNLQTGNNSFLLIRFALIALWVCCLIGYSGLAFRIIRHQPIKRFYVIIILQLFGWLSFVLNGLIFVKHGGFFGSANGFEYTLIWSPFIASSIICMYKLLAQIARAGDHTPVVP